VNLSLKQTELLTHEPNLERDWNESYYFVFYNRKIGLGGMTRLGFKPNKQEGMTFLILFLPDGSGGLFQSSVKISNEVRKKEMSVGGLSHRRLANGTGWNYSFDGKMVVSEKPEDLPKTRDQPDLVKRILDVKMDLSFNPISDTYEYSKNMTPESREIGRKSGDAHWEQIGKVTGKMQLGELEFNIQETIGQRDHTHGVRDWTGIGNWLYYVVWFSENLCINPAAIVTDEGRISSGGFIFENGENIPIKAIKVLVQEFRNSIIPVSSKIQVIDALNRTHILEGRPGPIVPLPLADSVGRISILTQSIGSFTLDGRHGGYGSYETLRKTN
jgi:hypothetical protein